MPLSMEADLDPGHIDGDPAFASSSKRGGGTAASQFSAHVYCGQTAGWITTPLRTDVGIGLGDIVLDGDPVLPQGQST